MVLIRDEWSNETVAPNVTWGWHTFSEVTILSPRDVQLRETPNTYPPCHLQWMRHRVQVHRFRSQL